MRICLLGNFDKVTDEAMKKTSLNLLKYLSLKHDVMALDLKKIISPSFWKNLREFKPEIIHYVTGSSVISFIILKLTSFISGSKTAISIMRPRFSKLGFYFIKILKPDLVIVQSPRTQKKFKDFNNVFLPVIGVDTDKFDSSIYKKDYLKSKFGIDTSKFVVLHVGSIKEGRNLGWLIDVQKKIENVQVVIVGATSQGIHKSLVKRLKDAGCIIWNRYFENIEEIYAMADCYAFPVVHKTNFMGTNKSDCIDMPLSVFEAMACNLPVVSTKFGGLSQIFEEVDGLIFVENKYEFVDAVKKIRSSNLKIKTREKVLEYTWNNTVEMLTDVYKKVKG